MQLSNNIRSFRKERSLTQGQLAETLGVTASAVYKWETSLSTPDINLIVELADLFDTSVDVLLGYEVKDNKRIAAAQALAEQFDRTPDYDVKSICFIADNNPRFAYDDMGTTAMQCMVNLLGAYQSETLMALWGRITAEGQGPEEAC
ncbi:MAG: helix-turn-helix domain-containing protein [Acetatifactor sp.]|nr:helix-turn-helix domain-containing protein [Acetatifactor sp.]